MIPAPMFEWATQCFIKESVTPPSKSNPPPSRSPAVRLCEETQCSKRTRREFAAQSPQGPPTPESQANPLFDVRVYRTRTSDASSIKIPLPECVQCPAIPEFFEASTLDALRQRNLDRG